MLKKLPLLMMAASSLLAMHEAELNLNNYDLDAKLHFDAGQFNEAVEPDSVFFGFGYLHGSHQHSDGDLKKDHDMVDGHFFVRQRLSGAPDLTFGMGVKFVYTDLGGYDYYALPLGITARYDLPVDSPIPISVGGALYYAPQVLAWEDAKNYLEYDAHVDIMLIERAGLTAGYRKINTDLDLPQGDLTFNETWFVGVKFRF